MKTKSQFCLVLIFLLLPVMLFAAGTKESGEDGAEGTIEMSLMHKEHTAAKLTSDWPYFDFVADETGVDLEIIPVPVADWDTKFHVTMASGDLPDIVFSGLSDAKYYGLQGAFIALEDLIDDHAPYTKQALAEFGSYHLLTDENNLYWYPNYIGPNLGQPKIPVYLLMYREDWMQKIGETDVPENLEEWYSLWKAVKQNDPDSIGLMAYGAMDIFFPYFAGAFGFNTHIDSLGWYWKAEGDQLVSARIHDNFKEMLKFFNQLYEDGILDPEYITRTKNSWSETVVAGNVFTNIYTGNRALWFTEQGRKAGIEDYQMLIARDPYGPYGQAGWWAGPFNTGEGFAVTVANEYPVKAVELLDFFLSPEGVTLSTWGKEGVSFELKDGAPVWTDTVQEKQKSEGWAFGGEYAAPAYWMFGPEPKYLDAHSNFLSYEWYIVPMKRNMEDHKMQIPELKLTNQEIDNRQSIESDVKPFFDEWVNDFVRGKKDIDSQWSEYIKGMKSLGEEDLQDIYTKAYQRYLTWEAGQ
jgi:putative aldouronate transport system substrate-binding protein